jgi:hypothetical protein
MIRSSGQTDKYMKANYITHEELLEIKDQLKKV